MARCRRSRGRPTDGGCCSCAPAAEARGVGRAASKQARMARRRKRRTLKPRVPSRVKRRKRAPKKAEVRTHQHPELIGLFLVALGGAAMLALPAVLVIVGALMVARSDLVDVRPFRTGLFVFACGLMITLGKDQGGYLGSLLGGGLAL